jgi:alkylation response protein AidB-like acyl-CoA dehydrogenase
MLVELPKNSFDIYEQIREMTADFAREQIRPQAERIDREEEFPEDLFKQMAELGLFGITIPESYGGGGVDCYGYAIVMEELSRGYSAVADQCGLVELVSTLIFLYGTDGQKERYLRSITGFDAKVAYCLTEAEAGSDLSAIKTTARPHGSGWRLTGSKLWINNGPLADVGIVLARTDPAKGHRGMSVFVVDLHAEGVSRGPKEQKMGQRGSHVGPLFFNEVELGQEALLGELHRGFYYIMSVLEKGRVGIGALAVGIAQAGLEAALEYAKTRKQFGSPVANFQGIQWLLAQMAMEIAAARGLVHRAALLLDNDKPATEASSMAKCYASDMAVRQTAEAVQIFGGSGYIKGYEVERLYRDAKITQIYEGTNQIQRTIIARQLLK